MMVTAPWSARQREYRKFVRTVALFQRRLNSVKEQTPRDFEWYPYDSLGTWCRLEKMFGGRCRRMLGRLAKEPLLDIGCADGELAFFLESLGQRVHAMDWPPTNYNGMRGVAALKTALDSSVEIHEVDLDSQFQLPVRRCGLALFLGVLYHLKNPFFVLEKLAQHCRYCIFSTTVTRFAPGREADLQDLPVAYLLDDGELNSDATNYWVFSEAGLGRLLKKTNWEILEFAAWGDTRKSVPDSPRRELRVFGLLKSGKFNDPADGAELLDGWHELEEDRWRWTKRRFSAAWETEPGTGGGTLRLEFFLPERLLTRVGRVGLAATVNGIPLERAEYCAAGRQLYERVVGTDVLDSGRVTVEFDLDSAIEPDDSDPRERGLIVSAVSLESSQQRSSSKPSRWPWRKTR
jgi:tRNA (mo5U34)-methyltransferase